MITPGALYHFENCLHTSPLFKEHFLNPERRDHCVEEYARLKESEGPNKDTDLLKGDVATPQQQHEGGAPKSPDSPEREKPTDPSSPFSGEGQGDLLTPATITHGAGEGGSGGGGPASLLSTFDSVLRERQQSPSDSPTMGPEPPAGVPRDTLQLLQGEQCENTNVGIGGAGAPGKGELSSLAAELPLRRRNSGTGPMRKSRKQMRDTIFEEALRNPEREVLREPILACFSQIISSAVTKAMKTVSKKTLASYLRGDDFLGPKLTPIAYRLFNLLDSTAGTSGVGHEAFVNVFVAMLRGSPESRIWIAFQLYDLNGDEVIGTGDLWKHITMNSVESRFVAPDIATLMQVYKKKNGDCFDATEAKGVTFEEFRNAFTRERPRPSLCYLFEELIKPRKDREKEKERGDRSEQKGGQAGNASAGGGGGGGGSVPSVAAVNGPTPNLNAVNQT
uniref:EF-hand domain-containing protein n=1 Tax=Chromera velia CCMP2878 TaxID=1169474 RepID=A0A0G4HUC9_9ALVE|eukprot:Cvel_8629.t1-p1 / transcript=Cvel_8629.t1 / gene=Cvel_8629 / organism=Chromera_velia_CCMP2878 / gene_product=hypothetical protein / transcript_product=hypothetical protein / location=Cvel_scaffold480:60977-67449(-) / protein_length=448 / sequence_SO=supercontig / SO=protein_coding / is_pseudo=false